MLYGREIPVMRSRQEEGGVADGGFRASRGPFHENTLVTRFPLRGKHSAGDQSTTGRFGPASSVRAFGIHPRGRHRSRMARSPPAGARMVQETSIPPTIAISPSVEPSACLNRPVEALFPQPPLPRVPLPPWGGFPQSPAPPRRGFFRKLVFIYSPLAREIFFGGAGCVYISCAY